MSDADLIQGSPEWHAARLGSFGGSRMGDLLAKGQGKTRAAYLLEIAAERISGQPSGWEGNDDTEFGYVEEPNALAAHGILRSCFVIPVGLIRHPTLPHAHASPDGIVEGERGVEMKSHRRFITHLKAIEGPIARDHMLQCQWGMACSGLPLWDYGNWCPAAPEHMRLHVREIKRDDRVIAELVVAVREAEIEVSALVAKYSNLQRAA